MESLVTDDSLVNLARELVRTETENPPGNEAPAAEYVVEWFEERGVEARLVYEPFRDRPQAVGHVGEGEPCFVLNGHLDVVPAGAPENWEIPPYEGRIEDGVLHGRGSADMKSGLAVGMMVAARLREDLLEGSLPGSVLVQAAIGEETADPGTRTLLELGFDGDVGVVLEPTGMRTATAAKGLAWYRIDISGEPAHASRPDQGTNAILAARPLLEALEEYDRRLRQRRDELLGSACVSVTQFDAGTKENVLPESGSLTLDRRFLPDESIADIDDEIDRVVSRVGEQSEARFRWERTRTYDAAAVEHDCQLARVLRFHSHRRAGVDREPWGIPASTDVRNLIHGAGMEAVTWGPGDLSQAHTVDECIDLEEVKRACEVLESTVRDVLESYAG